MAAWLAISCTFTLACARSNGPTAVADGCVADSEDAARPTVDSALGDVEQRDAGAPDAQMLDATMNDADGVDATTHDADIDAADAADPDTEEPLDRSCGGRCDADQVCSRLDGHNVCVTCFPLSNSASYFTHPDYHVTDEASARALRGYRHIRKLTMIDSGETWSPEFPGWLENLACAERIDDLSVGGTFDFEGLRNLREVTGNLTISMDYASADPIPVPSLAGFRQLQHVGGDLVIVAAWLQSLDGLEALAAVGGSLRIQAGNRIDNMEGLAGLIEVRGTLALSCAVSNLESLESLQHIGGLSLISMPLESLSGLPPQQSYNELVLGDLTNLNDSDALLNLTHVAGDVELSNWRPIDGLQNLRHVEGSLYVGDHLVARVSLPSLRSVGRDLTLTHDMATVTPSAGLTGFEQLTSIGGNLMISETSLSNIDVLDTLTHLGGIRLQRNRWLEDIDGLHSLVSTLPGSLIIEGNPRLATLAGLEPLTEVGGEISIHGNPLLQSLAPLDNLTVLDGDLRIFNNTTLPGCEASALADRLATVCECPRAGTYTGQACACADACDCSGNDNTASCTL